MYNVHHLCVQGIYTYKADVARAAIILWSYSKVLSLWQACHGKSTNISAIFWQVCQRAKVPFILIVSTWITHPTIPVIRNMKLTVMMQQNVEKWILEKNLVCLLWWVHEITQVMVKNCNFGQDPKFVIFWSLLTCFWQWMAYGYLNSQESFKTHFKW